jgi:tripartite-type tricarboxylate transporter receptor subunit TctC
MMNRTTLRAIGLAVAGGMAGLAASVQAATVEEFYRGKAITLTIGAATGGGYDLAARLVSRHMGRHIPGSPSFVARNMPGANSLPMTNHLYTVAPKDGSEIGAPNNGIAFEPLFNVLSKDGSNVRFDPIKFNWIGNPVQEVYLLFSWHTTPFKTFDDLAKGGQMIVGSMGPNADNTILPSILSQVTPAKFRIVHGYQGQNEVLLAMERGELNGAGGIGYNSLAATRGDWLRDKKVNILVQFAMTHHPDLPNVPLAIELVKSQEDRDVLEMVFTKYRMARPLVAPPDVPQERVTVLRRAFDATMKDAEFLKEAAKTGTDIDPVSGEEIEAVIRRVYAMPPALIVKAKQLLTPPT